MMKVLGVSVLMMIAFSLYADPLTCDLSTYKPSQGLTAAASNNTLVVTWDGERGQELRIRFGITSGTPTMQELAVRKRGGQWSTLAANIAPDYRVASGLRRMSNQQIAPLRGLGVDLTPEIVDRFRWDPFWDAPFDLSVPTGNGGNPPPAAGVANQPGLPRKPDEIQHTEASFHSSSCQVRTSGVRLEVAFPGVDAGVFSGSLQYTFFKGTNLIEQEILAKTAAPWVAYKYEAGLKGLTSGNGARVVWRDVANNWEDYRFGAVQNNDEVALKTTGRVVIAERGSAGSIAAFPPPHTFFWAREIAVNLGYNFYKKDTDTTFSFGVRQADHEDESENQANFALYSARPGTLQHMTVFLYHTADAAPATYEAALAFTHNDHYKAIPGYQVMNHHYHMDLGQRLGTAGSLDAEIPDLVALKALGINIVSQIDSVGFGAEGTPPGAVYPGARPVVAAPASAGAPAGRGGAPGNLPPGGRGAG